MDVTHAEHLAVGTRAWHWQVGGDDGPEWFATAETVRSADDRQERLASYETAVRIASWLSFAVSPVHTRDARVAVDVAPGLLLTLTPRLEGQAGAGDFVDDAQRAMVASMVGSLHRLPRPRQLPPWRPSVGGHSQARAVDLQRCLEQVAWSGGPWAVPTARLLAEARPVVERSLRRFALLAAAICHSADRWVVTHGGAEPEHMVETPDGPRLVGWTSLCVGPRERDLGEVLGAADADRPWYAYLEAGGRPEPLSPDTVEAFALQRHLSRISDAAALFCRTHADGPDERRAFGELEQELGALVERWTAA